MAANLFQVKTEMLKTDLTNLSKLLPDSPGFFFWLLQDILLQCDWKLFGTKSIFSFIFHVNTGPKHCKVLNLFERVTISGFQHRDCGLMVCYHDRGFCATTYIQLVWSTISTILTVYPYSSFSLYINAPVRSVKRKNKGRISLNSFTFHQILILLSSVVLTEAQLLDESRPGAWFAPWLTMQESCFAPFLFNTHVYPCLHSENQMAQCCCPSATGEILLSSSTLYEADLKSVLLQELFAMLLSNWIHW